jgi:hypothetical protein
MIKNDLIKVRIAAHEKDVVIQAADEAEMSTSAFIRRATLAAMMATFFRARFSLTATTCARWQMTLRQWHAMKSRPRGCCCFRQVHCRRNSRHYLAPTRTGPLVIIESKHVRARGQAVNRLITHLTNGDDNDSVELLRGNEAQLHDWRNDALRFGRQYSIRHWIIAPSQELSCDQLDEVVSSGAEFGFNPEQAVIWMHRKDRATTDGCSQHFHVLVAEVDPLSGKVMSTSHDNARHEKIAILSCGAWGIPFVSGPHAQTAARALEADGLLKAEDILQSQKLDHGVSFSERDYQIAKRQGFDLPRLRVLLSDALANAVSRADFERKLGEIGLHLEDAQRRNSYHQGR